MGLADVVPGVSGGTVAFVLGIYEQFMAALSSVNFHWIYSLFRYIFSGFKQEHLESFKHHFFRIHWAFLLTLLSGMLGAIVLGSAFVPVLMDQYPSQMRAFFLGLVLASIAVPFSEIGRKTVPLVGIALALAVAIFFILGAKGEPPVRWSEATATQSQTLREFTREHPGVREPSAVYCPSQGPHDNASLRQQTHAEDPVLAARLDDVCARLAGAKDNPQALATLLRDEGLDDKHSDPFSQLQVPATTQIWVAKPALWFIFLAGAIAICAMVLPGISGSFLLLILGAYYFVFSSLRGTIGWLIGRSESAEPLLYVVVFMLGILLGVMSFSRVLTVLFRDYKDLTLAALIGIMVGSLRVLWPFQIGSIASGATRNVMPTAADPVLMCAALVVIGFLVVVGLAQASKKLENRLAN